MAVDSTKYSLYAQRDLEKQYVNWGQVAKDVTAGITTIAGERKARKDALDNLTNEAMENLSAVPDVQSQNAGALIINASDMSKKNLQIQYDLMKRGLISTKDFQLFLQQQKNDYSSYSTSIKNWDGWYQKSLDKINKGEAAADELYNMVSLEGFGNLQDKALLTNPANGRLQLVQMDEDNDGNYTITPDAQTNPEKFISPHGINMRMNLQSKKKVLTDEVKALVDPLGKFIRQEIGATGTSVTKEGLVYAEKGTYDEFIKSSVDSLTATNNDQMQILAGQGYQIAQSEAEFKKLYGEDADLKKWIKLEYKKGIPTYSLNVGDIDEKSKEIAKNAIDQQLDDVFKEDKQVSSTGTGYKLQKQQGQEMLTNLKAVYSATDQQNLDNALKSIMSLTGLSFDEIDQEIVNGEIVSIKVPYIGEGGTKTFINLDLQSKKTVKGKDVYTPIPFNEFAKQAYEYLNLGTEKKFVPFSDLDIDLEEEVIFNPYSTPTFELMDDGKLGMPSVKEAEEGKFYKNPKTEKGYIFKNGKYVEITPTDRQFAATTITPFEGRGAVTLGTNVGTAEKSNIVGDEIRKIAKEMQTFTPITQNTDYAKEIRDASATMVKEIGEYLGVSQSVIQGFEPSVDGSTMNFKLPAITLPDGTTIPAKDIELLYEKATEAEIEKTMQNIINHMYPEYAAGEVSSRGTTGDGTLG